MVSRFHPNRDRDRYRDRLFNHGTHRTHGKAWLCFRVFSVFRSSNQKLRSAPNRCGADLNGSQCLRGFAQNLHAQLLFLGLKVHPALRANTPHRRCTPCPNLACAHTLKGVGTPAPPAGHALALSSRTMRPRRPPTVFKGSSRSTCQHTAPPLHPMSEPRLCPHLERCGHASPTSRACPYTFLAHHEPPPRHRGFYSNILALAVVLP